MGDDGGKGIIWELLAFVLLASFAVIGLMAVAEWLRNHVHITP